MGTVTSRLAPWASATPETSQLSESVAWAIAIAWHPLLRTRMKLTDAFPTGRVSQKDEVSLLTYSMVEDVMFVDFQFQSLDPQNLERVAPRRSRGLHCRAASDAWSRRHQVPSYRFFPDPTRPFPNVRLSAQHADVVRVVELFLHGQASSKKEKRLVSKLQTLARFIVDPRWHHDLPVALGLLELGSFQQWLPDWSRPRPTDKQLPHLRLNEIYCHDEFATHTIPAVIDNILAITNVHLCFMRSLDGAGVCGRIGRVLEDDDQCIENPRVHVNKLVLCVYMNRYPNYEYEYFPACCSMLPHTREVQSVYILDNKTPISGLDVAWLGYAMFHPDSAARNTSFTCLTLGLRADYIPVLRQLESMATGNNLLVALSVTTITSSSYAQAKLRVGTRIRLPPRFGHVYDDVQDDHTVMYTCAVDVRVTVCCIDPAITTTSVRGVFPGRGLGWVDTTNIIDVVESTSGPSCVRRLRLVIPESYDGEDELLRRDYLVAVLSLLGRQPEFLDIVNYHQLSASTVHNLLDLCPNLKSLRVRHDGSRWSSDSAMLLPDLPQLEELELIPDDRLAALDARQLCRLRRFHVVNALPGSFRANRASFISVLALYPDLEIAMWQARPSPTPVSVDLLEKRELELLGDDLVHGVHDVARVPMTWAERLAYLSVIRHSSRPIGDLSPDVVRLIFRLSSSFKPRAFHIRDFM